MHIAEVPSPDMQESFNTLCGQRATLDAGLKPNGKYWWAKHPSLNLDLMPLFRTPLLDAVTGKAVLDRIEKQHQDFATISYEISYEIIDVF